MKVPSFFGKQVRELIEQLYEWRIVLYANNKYVYAPMYIIYCIISDSQNPKAVNLTWQLHATLSKAFTLHATVDVMVQPAIEVKRLYYESCLRGEAGV